MIRALLAARYVTFTAVVLLLVVLAWSGKRVSYEQSINSFFAEDDPYMRVYQQAAETFGDDNFIFLVYDDPALLTPAGLDRVSELAASVAPDRIAAVERVESLDAMPLALVDRRRPAGTRPPAQDGSQSGSERRQAGDQERRPENQRDDGGGRRPDGRGRRHRAGRDQGSADAASALSGHADRRHRHDDGGGRAAEKDSISTT